MSVQQKPTVDCENLAQTAYKTFAQKKTLTFYFNRRIAHLPSRYSPLDISQDTRDKIVACSKSKTNEWASYFFSDLDGETRYVNKDVIDRFSELAEAKFPDLNFTSLYALVDEETDTELLPIDSPVFRYIDTSCNKIAVKTKAAVAKAYS